MTFSNITRTTLALGGALLLAGCSAHDDGASSDRDPATKTPAGKPSGNESPPTEAPPIDPPPGPNDVVGVVQGRLGGPVPGATIASGDVIIKTDAWGRFVLRNLPPKYDLQCGIDGQGEVYYGLTTRNPTIQSYANGWYNRAPIHLDYSEATSTNSRRRSFTVGDDGSTRNILAPSAPPDAVDTSLYWAGPTPALTGRFFSLEHDTSTSGPPTRYLGYAFSPMRLLPSNRETTTFKPTYLPITTTSTVTGVARPPPGVSGYETYLLVHFGGQYDIVNLDHPSHAVPAEFVVPEVPGASWALQYRVYGPGLGFEGASSSVIVPISTDGSVPDVDIPVAPKIISPADGAADFGVGSEIAWEGGEGACTVNVFFKGVSWAISLTTLTSRFTMPDLSAVGVPIARRFQYTINVQCSQRANRPPDADPVLDAARYIGGQYNLGTSAKSRNVSVTSP
ncbi:hypothetical protein LVJ94_52235 [Pendulispora rubella]|uniref:Uncharacterized protein n=1 Tax=Pendulispora rubella TaxID=2741070 RepID=A0ABZ2L3C3_9BACT